MLAPGPWCYSTIVLVNGRQMRMTVKRGRSGQDKKRCLRP